MNLSESSNLKILAALFVAIWVFDLLTSGDAFGQSTEGYIINDTSAHRSHHIIGNPESQIVRLVSSEEIQWQKDSAMFERFYTLNKKKELKSRALRDSVIYTTEEQTFSLRYSCNLCSWQGDERQRAQERLSVFYGQWQADIKELEEFNPNRHTEP